MILLPIAITSQEWHAVKTYIATRSADLIEAMSSPAATDQARRDAAMRLDELKTLMRAPDETLAASASKARADESRRTTY